MVMTLVPGYKELFGIPTQTYEQVIADIPSVFIITVAIMLKAELTADRPGKENQKRLRSFISHRFSKAQNDALNRAFYWYKLKTRGLYDETLFADTYLTAMITRELNRNLTGEAEEMTPNQEYNFLIAYLMIVDEVNEAHSQLMNKVNEKSEQPFFEYRLLWVPAVGQFQFNDSGNMLYETYKLFCLFKYFKTNHRQALATYLDGFQMHSIGVLINSFFQIGHALQQHHEENFFHKLTFYNPPENLPVPHLEFMSINQLLGTVITLPDLKKYPLYYSGKFKYMVIDQSMYLKKMYKGPFFDLRYGNFNEYSREISTEVMEKMCFQGILQHLRRNRHEVLHFDDGSDAVPDCYYRDNNIVFLFEFKAYLFPDRIPDAADFDQIKNYIDERLVKNDKGKGKGVSQLSRQIELLVGKKFTFDQKYCSGQVKNTIIFPILCFDDFHFSLPGINDYLNDIFEQQITPFLSNNVTIRPVTIINLDILLEIFMNGGNFKILTSMVERYWHIKADRKKRFKQQRSTELFLSSWDSFQEVFYTRLYQQFPKHFSKEIIVEKMLSSLNLTQADLDEVIMI